MPNHVHAVIVPIRDGASSLIFVDRFKGRTSHDLHEAGYVGDVWQDRYFDHLLRDDESLAAITDYILANPVRAGLVARAEDYLWSWASL